MFTQKVADSPRNRRGNGQVSYLLLANGQFGSAHLAVTWVEGAAGSQQSLHAHPGCEQAYVIVAGDGQMITDEEEHDVEAGTMVFVPPDTPHAIRNPGPGTLVYVSATSPPFETPEAEFAYQPPASERAARGERRRRYRLLLAARPLSRRGRAVSGDAGAAAPRRAALSATGCGAGSGRGLVTCQRRRGRAARLRPCWSACCRRYPMNGCGARSRA